LVFYLLLWRRLYQGRNEVGRNLTIHYLEHWFWQQLNWDSLSIHMQWVRRWIWIICMLHTNRHNIQGEHFYLIWVFHLQNSIQQFSIIILFIYIYFNIGIVILNGDGFWFNISIYFSLSEIKDKWFNSFDWEIRSIIFVFITHMPSHNFRKYSIICSKIT